jgi:hypothetical protein
MPFSLQKKKKNREKFENVGSTTIGYHNQTP